MANANQNGGKNRSQFPNNKGNKKSGKKAYQTRGNNKNQRPGASGYNKQKPDVEDNSTKISEYSNDPGWWENNNGLTESATQIGTRTPIGFPLDYGILNRFTPTGILRLDYAPCFGTIDSVVDGVNVAAKNLYNKINAQNSRSSSYDPNDLAVYIVAVANAWVLHAWLRRLIGAINSYSAQNRYWFDPLLQSMNVAPIDDTNTITTWVNLADWIALQLDRLPVPEDIAYFVREQRMCEAFYADNLVEKAGIVYLNPVSLLKYTYDDEGKGMLEWFDTPWKRSTGRDIRPDVVRRYFNELTENLFNDSDTVLMQSDIRRAFASLYTLGKVDPDFTCGLQYDANLNLQIKNATVHQYLWNARYTITQNMDKNILVSNDIGGWVLDNISTLGNQPYTARFNSFDNEIFDFPTDSVSSQAWTEATKLHAFWVSSAKFHATTEVVLRALAFTFVAKDGAPVLEKLDTLMFLGIMESSSISGSTFAEYCNRIQAVQKFANAPLQFAIILRGTLVDSNFKYNVLNFKSTYIFNDLNNFVPVPTVNLATINDYAQLSILTQGKFSDNHIGVGKL